MKDHRPATETTIWRMRQYSRESSLWSSMRTRLVILVLIALLPALALVI